MTRSTLLALAAAPLLAAAVPAPLAAPAVAITEWEVPYPASRPRDPFVAPDGKVWFVGQVTNYVAWLDPATGEFRRYEAAEGAYPHNVIVDPQGIVWYAGNMNATIGRLDPATGKITSFPMTHPNAKDPHTLVLDAKRGVIWFTAQNGNGVGRFDVRTGATDVVPVPTPRARPYGIWLDSSGRPWFVEFGTNKVGTIDPATLRLEEVTLPDERSRPRRMAITSDDAVWVNDYVRGTLIRLDPKTRTTAEWPLPSGQRALPYAMTVDDRDRIWVVETGVQPNRFVGFDTRTKRVIDETPIAESGGGTVRHMVFDPKAGAVWFGTDANTIGRAVVR